MKELIVKLAKLLLVVTVLPLPSFANGILDSEPSSLAKARKYLRIVGVNSHCAEDFPIENNFGGFRRNENPNYERIQLTFHEHNSRLFARVHNQFSFVMKKAKFGHVDFDTQINPIGEREFEVLIFLPKVILTYFLTLQEDGSIDPPFISEGSVKLYNGDQMPGRWVGHCYMDRLEYNANLIERPVVIMPTSQKVLEKKPELKPRARQTN